MSAKKSLKCDVISEVSVTSTVFTKIDLVVQDFDFFASSCFITDHVFLILL